MSAYNTLSGMDPVEEAIAAARLSLMLNDPFLGNLVVRMPFIEDTTNKIRTMGTDGLRVWFNREFVKNCNIPQLFFVVAHEVVHAIADHIARCGNRDPSLWNTAVDAYTNALLIDMKLGEMPKAGIYYKEFSDLNKWAAESIYDALLAKGVKGQIPLDDHLELKEMPDGETGEARVSVVAGDGTEIAVTDGDMDELRRQIRDNILAASHAAAGTRMSSSVERLINAFLKPKVDWRGLISSSIRSLIKNDQSYTVYNKKSGQIIFAGDIPENTINVVLYIDSSGSIDDEALKIFLTEVYGIMTQFSNYKIHLAAFDDTVHNYKMFTPENGEELARWQIDGSGGTNYGAFWKHLASLDIQEEFTTIVLTDGQPADSTGWNKKDIPYNVTDIVFILKGAPRTIQPPYGRWAHID